MKEEFIMSKPEYIFEKDFWGNWKLVPKKEDNALGWVVVAILVLVILCLVIITLPLWVALLGFKMFKTKRYYAGIGSLLAMSYFLIDVEKRWITGFLFQGYYGNEGKLTKGLFKYEYLNYVYILNSIGVILGIIFIIQSYLLNRQIQE
jgi:hypothetical protein